MNRINFNHITRDLNEMAELVLKNGFYTAPLGLPHYRYQQTRKNCMLLVEHKILRKKKVNHEFNVEFIAGPNMQLWEDAGKPKLFTYLKSQVKLEKYFKKVENYIQSYLDPVIDLFITPQDVWQV